MKLIRPLAITDSNFLPGVSNIPEADLAAYSAGTTYALNATVQVTVGQVLTNYVSLQAGNIGNTPGASPTWWQDLAAPTYLSYSSATTYSLGLRVKVITGGVHHNYESLQNTNLNHDPTISPTWWLDVGPTNQWKMFDNGVATATSRFGAIDASIVSAGAISDGVAFLNVSAVSIRVTVTDTIDGVVYDTTTTMVADSGVLDYYAYFFEPIVRIGELVLTGLPPYAGATIRAYLDGSGGIASCGVMVLGSLAYIGRTVYGATVGLLDYSVKGADAFGSFTALERGYARRGDFGVSMKVSQVTSLQNLLIPYRAKPLVWIGTDFIGATVIYGFYKDFQTTIAYFDEATCALTIEGLA